MKSVIKFKKMNIFILDLNPVQCAKYHCDKHVIKMILEYGQLLSNAHWSVGKEGICRKSHFNHPCSIWARFSIENYKWLSELAVVLCDEYTYRYDKTHAWADKIKWLKNNVPDLSAAGLTPFVQAMPDYCRSNDAVQAYRKYYKEEKRHIVSWKRRMVPEW